MSKPKISAKMYCKLNYFIICLSFLSCIKCFSDLPENGAKKWPTIGISVLVRNKAHTLPYFLTCLHELDYPKNRMYVWIYSDFNIDNSIEIIEKWIEIYSSQYSAVHLHVNKTSGPYHVDETEGTLWTPAHYNHVISLREKALNFARKTWADYIFMIDADVYLTNSATLKLLVAKNTTVVAPMLVSDGLYSNFWCGMTENFYYKRTEDYKLILNRDKLGCFEVPMVHTAVLVNLNHIASDKLTYSPKKVENYNGPQDDIITFAINCKNNGITLHVCNDHKYGFIQVPLEENSNLETDREQLLNIKLEAISQNTPLPLDNAMEKYVVYPKPWKYGCDEIFVINLERRSERRKLMELSFKELGMDVKLFNAVDGSTLDINNLSKYSIKFLPNYEDPYHKRPMKAGEIGCFLSHYYIWKQVVINHYRVTLVLEDDIHFVPYFKFRFLHLLEELKDLEWDLVYIGRKVLLDSEEEYVKTSLTKPRYSYWTLGYLISERGAQKLLAAEPLTKMLPVDEFLPIMFDQHPNNTWKSYFPKRDLVAFSAAPLLIHPTHYTGEEGYISDTEDSHVIAMQTDDSKLKTEL